MQSRSFAPIARAVIFFGFVAVAVTGMTLGSGFQRPGDMSSTTVAELKMQEQNAAAERLARINQAPVEVRVQQANAPAGSTAIR